MITFTCDRCKKTIDVANEIRFVVSIEVQAAFGCDHSDILHEHLDKLSDELSEAFDGLDSQEQEEISHQVYDVRNFDLCEKCREEYGKNLLGVETTSAMGFSNN
jgi:thiol-disulfide isomerase/thioredoxin